MKTISRRAAIQCLLSLLPSPFIIPSPTERVLLAVPKRKRAFKHSDVVFSFVFSPEEYKMWHGTLLYGWCGAPATKDEIPKYLDRQKKSLEVGVPEGASISGFSGNLSWFQEQDPDWKEALWRDSDDHLLTYPWVRPPDPFPPEKGEICTNHPKFVEKKLAETDLAMAIKPYAFHVDDPLGTATVLRIKGCFCKYCMKGFRDYLKKAMSSDQIEAAGIHDIDSFDYGKFLKSRTDRPLAYEFENFQLRSSVEHIRQVMDYVRKKRVATIPVGANAPVVGAHIVFAPYLDYIAAEIGTDATEMKFGGKPLLNYKMGDALGVAIAATGIYKDWVMLTNHDIPDLVRGWIAESYALGGNFIVPHKEWGFVQPPGKEPQSTAYPAKPEIIAPLYQFVRDDPELFDDYQAVTQVGLLYDYRATRLAGAGAQMPQTPEKQPVTLHEICLALANANIPFGMAVAGSEPLDHEMRLEDLAKYEFLIVQNPLMVRGKQRELLDVWTSQGKVIGWTDVESVRSRVRPLVAVEPARDIWALPRVNPDRLSFPLVCHVLNRSFDAKTEKMVVQKNIRVRLNKELFDGRKHDRCTLFMEKVPPASLPVQFKGDWVDVTLPELELWGILRFS